MSKKQVVFIVSTWIAMASVVAFGGATDRMVPTPPVSEKGDLAVYRSQAGMDIPIPDSNYDGTLASMACLDVTGINATITEMQVVAAIEHTWVGDLTVKLVSPSSEVLTLMSRPGFAEAADDGTGCCGNSADILLASPVTFDDAAATSAELMGDPGQIVCFEDGICDYFPFPDTGPGTNLAQFNGQNAAGTWQVCVGDSAGGDVGEIDSAAIIFNGLFADLEITKDAPNGIGVGGPFDFELTVYNNGPSDQTGVVVSDSLPANLSYVGDNCGGSAVGQDWTWNIGALTNGASAACTLSVSLATSTCEAVTNTATVTGGVSDPVTANNSATHTNAGVDAVTDGSFEGGSPNASWAEASVNFGSPLCTIGLCGTGSGTGPHMGDWWTWFGGIDIPETGSMTQSVTIAAGATDLTFWLEAIACDSPADFMNVTIDGNVIFTINGGSPLCGSLGYTQQTVDISAYADDGVHTLEFLSQTFANNAGGTNFFVDDVSLTSVSCTTIQPPQDRAVPTLNAAGIALLVGLLAGAAFVLLRRLS